MKYLRTLLMLLLLPAGNTFAAEHDLVIYHTNDVHGYAFASNDQEGKLTRIGYDRLKSLLDADETEHKLLVDAGDVLHGQALATAQRGEVPAQILSLMGYDALAVGNHDFDYGAERLKYLADKYRLKFLAANVTEAAPGTATDNFMAANITEETPGTAMNKFRPWLIRSWGDLKVGIFALSTPETTTSTDPRNVAGLTFGDPIAAANEMVKELRGSGAELVIALTHLGSEEYCRPSSLELAAAVPGLDLIVDGHSHSAVAQRVTRPDGGEALVVSSGSGFENVGRVYADRKPGGGWVFSPELLPAAALLDQPLDFAMGWAMEALKGKFLDEMDLVVMETPFTLDGARENIRHRSTNLGRLGAAALVEGARADAALINSGSFRDSINQGSVTKAQLLSVLPYGNYVYVVEISGADLLAALNHGLARPGSGAFPQFWGLAVEAEALPGGAEGALRAARVTVGEKPLDPKASYRLAINDFLHSGGDDYTMFAPYEAQEFATLEEMFRQFVIAGPAEKLRAISEAEVLRLMPW